MSTRYEYVNWRVDNVLEKIGEEALAKGKGSDWHTALDSVMKEILIGQLRTLVGIEWDHNQLKESHEKQLIDLKNKVNELVLPMNELLYDRADLFPSLWYWRDRGDVPIQFEGGFILPIP